MCIRDRIDLVLVAFAGNDKLAPNLAQAVDDDIRRRIQQAVLVVDVEVDEHGIGRCNVQVVAACAKIGALKAVSYTHLDVYKRQPYD